MNDRRIAISYAKATRGWVAVSTVRLPLDWWNGDENAYETMVFAAKPGGGRIKSYRELDCRRYTTANAAKAGHAEVTQEWGKVKPNRVPPPIGARPPVRRP